MVRPKEDDIACSSVQRLDSLTGRLGQAKVGDAAERLAKLRLNVVAGGHMIGVPEDADVGVQSLKSVSSVLCPMCQRRHVANLQGLTAESRVKAAWTSL